MSSFLAYLSRLKYTYRWGLMRSAAPENTMEHTYMVSVIAHTLAAIANTRHGGNLDIEKVALYALFHDATEALTGDLPTPVKYFDEGIRSAYANMEAFASEKLLGLIPADLQPSFEHILKPDKNSDEWKTVKAADRMSAYLKCVEELKTGNTEFAQAHEEIGAELNISENKAVRDFLTEFAPPFAMTLDQLGARK